MYKKILLLGLISSALLLVACKNTTMDSNQELAATPANPKSATNASDINVQLAMGYLQQGNVQRAKSKLLVALQQSPDHPPALNAMGYYLERVGEVKQAEQYYLKALYIAPADGSVQNNYGTFLCRTGRYKASIDHFMLAIKDPNYLSSAEAYENAGLCSLKLPNYQLAEQFFYKAVLADPQRDTSIEELVRISYRQGDLQKANRYIQQYTKLSTPSTKILSMGIQIAQKLGDKPAVAYYRNLLKSQAQPISPISYSRQQSTS